MKIGLVAVAMLLVAGLLTMCGERLAWAQGEQRLVFAHYLVCCPRAGMVPTVEDLIEEILEAKRAGIDGFALNCGEWKANSLYRRNSERMFEAARRSGTDFKLFFSADYAGLLPAEEAADMVISFAGHSNYARHNGRPILSTYAGDKDWGDAIRSTVRERSDEEIFFVPFFFPRSMREIPTAQDVRELMDSIGTGLDGYFYFGPAGSPAAISGAIRLHAAEWKGRGKLFMAGVAAYYRGLRTNYRVFESDGFDGLTSQWKAAIESGAQWVELLTWNDWGEATYFAPLNPHAPADQWEQTMGPLLSHDALLELNAYYAAWFKAGSRPAIDQERVYYAYRLHTRGVLGKRNPPTGEIGRPRGLSSLKDRVYVLTMLRDPARIVVRVGAASHTLTVPAGISQLSVPMSPGRVTFEMMREDSVVARKSGEHSISWFDGWGNFNLFVGKFDVPTHH